MTEVRRFRAVTTCNAQGWEQTGRAMAQSFVEHWVDVPLVVYAEGFVPDVAGVDVRELPDWHARFKAAHAADPKAHGMTAFGRYNFRRDCVRFSHKVAAITDAGEDQSGVLIWLDADTRTFDTVRPAWLEDLLGPSAYMAWLGRDGVYPECGFLMFDTEHPAHREIMGELRRRYESGEVFDMSQTHDSYVIEDVILTAKAMHKIMAPRNLSGPHSTRGHPWLGSRLAERMDHLKGARKALGRTPRHERLVKDGNSYWR